MLSLVLVRRFELSVWSSVVRLMSLLWLTPIRNVSCGTVVSVLVLMRRREWLPSDVASIRNLYSLVSLVTWLLCLRS